MSRFDFFHRVRCLLLVALAIGFKQKCFCSSPVAKTNGCRLRSTFCLDSVSISSNGSFWIASINEPQKTGHLTNVFGEKVLFSAFSSILKVESGENLKIYILKLPRQGRYGLGSASPLIVSCVISGANTGENLPLTKPEMVILRAHKHMKLFPRWMSQKRMGTKEMPNRIGVKYGTLIRKKEMELSILI